MIIDFRRLDDGREIAADICIIGAGAAGITLARSLIGSKLRVCVLESGGFELDSTIQSLYDGELSGLRYPDLEYARLRYFGGSTNHWGGWCGPLSESDFEPRSWVPFSGWPIRKRDLDAYYRAAQTICQLGVFRYDAAAWENETRRFPVFHPDKLRCRFWQFSPPTRFGMVYRAELEQADNVQVYLHANVTELEPEANGGAVRRVRIRTPWGETATARARCYVLACGGIENARLLLLSSRTGQPGLGDRSDLVGRFFMDHPTVVRAAVLYSGYPGAMQTLFEPFTDEGQRVLAGLCPTEAAQHIRRMLNASVTFGHAPDLEAELAARPPSALDRSLWQFRSAFGRGPSRTPGVYQVVTRTEHAPDPQNRVTLTTERDALGLPKTRLHVRLSSHDLETIRSAVTLIAEELGRLGLGMVRFDEWLTEQTLTAPESPAWNCHHLGTTRMSDDPTRGVVDRHCRMHSVQNLYVAGSSVFPTCGYMNPTLTIVALALRLGDHLVGRLS